MRLAILSLFNFSNTNLDNNLQHHASTVQYKGQRTQPKIGFQVIINIFDGDLSNGVIIMTGLFCLFFISAIITV